MDNVKVVFTFAKCGIDAFCDSIMTGFFFQIVRISLYIFNYFVDVLLGKAEGNSYVF